MQSRPLSVNASAAEVQAALQNMSSLGVVEVKLASEVCNWNRNVTTGNLVANGASGNPQVAIWCSVQQRCGWNITMVTNVRPGPLRLLGVALPPGLSLVAVRLPFGGVNGGARERGSTEVSAAQLLDAGRHLAASLSLGHKSGSRIGNSDGVLSVVITGLRNAMRLPFTVAVRASSLYKFGPAAKITVRAPSAPAAVHAHVLDQHRVRVRIAAPFSDNGGLITRVNVSWRSLGQHGWQQQRLRVVHSEAAWLRVYTSSFGSTRKGWTSAGGITSMCGDWGPLLGGHLILGANARLEKVYTSHALAAPHTGLRLTFNLALIDDWGGGSIRLLVDGQEAWRIAPFTNARHACSLVGAMWDYIKPLDIHGVSRCGGMAADRRIRVEVWVPHHVPTASVLFESDSKAGFWGLEAIDVFLTATLPTKTPLFVLDSSFNRTLWEFETQYFYGIYFFHNLKRSYHGLIFLFTPCPSQLHFLRYRREHHSQA